MNFNGILFEVSVSFLINVLIITSPKVLVCIESFSCAKEIDAYNNESTIVTFFILKNFNKAISLFLFILNKFYSFFLF